MKKAQFLFLAVILVSGRVMHAQEAGAKPKELPFIPGFIFSTSNLLFDVDAYMGGFGGKLLYPDYALRVMANVGYRTSPSERLDLAAGLIYQKPLFPRARVTPYYGVGTELGFSYDYWKTDSDNWTETRTFIASVGGILGVEVFILDFLSVFAEYKLSAGLSWAGVSQETAGVGTSDSKINYEIATGLGNRSMIGVVVYLKPSGVLSKNEASWKK